MALTPGFGFDLGDVLPESGSMGGEGPAEERSPPKRPTSGKTTEERQQDEWGYLETKDFLAIRAQIERDNIEAKGTSNKMWNIISSQMTEKGHKRTPKQCKLQWRVLVNRFKATQVEGGDIDSFLEFYVEIDAIFKERAKALDRILQESEAGTVAYEVVHEQETLEVAVPGERDIDAIEGEPSHLKAKAKLSEPDGAQESEEDPSGNDLEGNRDTEEPDAFEEMHLPKKRKYSREDRDARVAQATLEVLKQFHQQQVKLEESWRETLDGIDLECRQSETEWLKRLEAFQKQRLEQERVWQVAEQERRAREEARSEQRDKLIFELISKISHSSSR